MKKKIKITVVLLGSGDYRVLEVANSLDWNPVEIMTSGQIEGLILNEGCNVTIRKDDSPKDVVNGKPGKSRKVEKVTVVGSDGRGKVTLTERGKSKK